MLKFFKRSGDTPPQEIYRRNRRSVTLNNIEWKSAHDMSYSAVLHRIEISFDQLEARKISIETFEKVILSELASLQHDQMLDGIDKIFDLDASVEQDHCLTLEALGRCLDWAKNFREAAQLSTRGSSAETWRV